MFNYYFFRQQAIPKLADSDDIDAYVLTALNYPVIEQTDMYTHVFVPIDEENVCILFVQ